MTKRIIETVFLDAGGVLVLPNWDRVSDGLEREGVLVSASVLAAADPHAKRQLDDPTLIDKTSDEDRGPTYFDLILDHAGVERSAATDRAIRTLTTDHRKRNLWDAMPDEVPGALERMRVAGLRMVVVSNANGTLHDMLEELGILASFDIVFDSYLEGVEKPDPRLFELALERSGASPATTVHVGDLFHIDVVGARSAGLEGWLLDAANVYDDVDCPRFSSLSAVADAAVRRAPPRVP